MTLIRLQDACLAYGDAPLLDGANLVLSAGERIGLIGRNGTGKSSLLKVLAGHTMPDDGAIHRRDGLRIALVEQEPILPEAPSLRASLLARASSTLPADERERWACEVRLAEQLHRFGLDGHESTQSLSGGQRKRGALGLALALQADLLLLDEPTNHLDLTGIEQLERALIAKGAPSLVLITHDRAFLDQVSTRIIELDRGRLRSYPGGYSAFESRKASELQAEEKATGRFEKFWAQEEAWIRKGIEARRTRNAGRVTRLETLRSERAARRERAGTIALKLDAGERSGKLVAELEGVSKAFDERPIIADFSTRILRGDRIGLIGPNGAGKSTLIKLITGELPPDQGRIRRGTGLTIAYFDQMRAGLDLEKTVAQNIAPGSDWIEVGGVRKHVASYLSDFLFSPQRANTPVSILSGGERARLLLARLFAQPANLLIMDEPTNDLDIESLELLEDTLRDYPGTLLLVSHDRQFLDNVVTQVWAAEGNGRWREYVGGYTDWLAQRPVAPNTKSETPTKAATDKPARAGKLSYKEQRTLESLPSQIEALEREQSELIARMSEPHYHSRGAQAIKADQARAQLIEAELEQKFNLWEQLESR